MQTERRALVVSTVVALALGIVALVAGLFTGSGAILLDGAFNLCFFGTALLTLRIARLLERPDDERYPFGYVQFEPLINMVKGLLIIGVGLLAVADAGLSLSQGGQTVSTGPAMAYAGIGSLVCLSVLVFLWRAEARLRSPLVRGDVDNWAVNAAITAGMLLAFVAAFLLQRANLHAAARLVDPILVILIVAITAYVPIRMVRVGLNALLQRSAAHVKVKEIDAAIRRATGDLAPADILVRALRPGRTTYVLAHVVLGDDRADVTVRETDQCRADISSALSSKFAPVVVDVVFTCVAEFAQPTAGYSEAANLE